MIFSLSLSLCLALSVFASSKPKLIYLIFTGGRSHFLGSQAKMNHRTENVTPKIPNGQNWCRTTQLSTIIARLKGLEIDHLHLRMRKLNSAFFRTVELTSCPVVQGKAKIFHVATRQCLFPTEGGRRRRQIGSSASGEFIDTDCCQTSALHF